MDNKGKKLIIIITVIILILLIISGGMIVITKLLNKDEEVVEEINEYNKEVYVSTTLPNIPGNSNTIKDEFGKKTNRSEKACIDKKWKNLDFVNFSVYSYNSLTSVISFDIVNNTNMIIETSDFQLQLKDDSESIVSIIDFESIVLPCGGKASVTVDVTGDITNVQDIIVDEINYTMEIQEVN